MITQSNEPSKKELKHMSYVDYEDIMLARRLTPHRINFLPRHTWQNDFMRRTIMIKNFPSSISASCVLSAVSRIKSTTFSMRTQPLIEGKAQTLINNQINNKTAKRRNSSKITEQLDAEADEDNIIEFYKELQKGRNKIFMTNIFIEFYGRTEEELDSKEREIKNILLGYKITYDILRFEQKEGFTAVNPLGKDLFLKTANNIPSSTLANLYPFSFSNRNDAHGLWLGETIDGGNVFLDFDARNEEITNGNFSIIGQSGQGKTWLMKKIASQMIFSSHSIFLLDPDKDYVEMIPKLKGTVINCASGRVKINPFEVRRIMTDEMIEHAVQAEDPEDYENRADAFKHKNIFFQHLSWLKEFFTVLYPEISAKELNALMIFTQDMYTENGITEETNFDMLNSEDYPTFSNLYEYIEKCFNDNNYGEKHISEELINNILLMLRDTYDGALGYVFNGHTNVKNSSIIDFDINTLLTGSRNRMQAVIFNIMTYVWNRIAQRKENIVFAVDELSLLLDRKNPVIAQYLRDFSKRARKYGAIIGTATQQIQDVDDPEIRHITRPILANTSFKFLFYPDHSGIDTVRDMLKLTDGEVKCISKPKMGHCLLKAGDDKYYIHVGELPYEKKLFGKLSG